MTFRNTIRFDGGKKNCQDTTTTVVNYEINLGAGHILTCMCKSESERKIECVFKTRSNVVYFLDFSPLHVYVNYIDSYSIKGYCYANESGYFCIMSVGIIYYLYKICARGHIHAHTYIKYYVYVYYTHTSVRSRTLVDKIILLINRFLISN
jgi:hypothetical protein